MKRFWPFLVVMSGVALLVFGLMFFALSKGIDGACLKSAFTVLGSVIGVIAMYLRSKWKEFSNEEVDEEVRRTADCIAGSSSRCRKD